MPARAICTALRAKPGITAPGIWKSITSSVIARIVGPGAVIPGFARKAVQMARAGIYDLRIHHDDIVMPLIRQWRLFELEGLDEEGEQARQELVAALTELDAQATRFVEQREEAAAKREARRA